MSNSINDAGVFLIQIIFDSYVFILMLRLLLQFFGANYYNPLSQFTVKLTDPIILPLRRVIPTLKQIDTATVVAILAILMIKITLLLLIQMGIFPNLVGLVVLSLAHSLDTLINIFFYAILMMVIISWVNPTLHSPVTDILFCLTNPLLGRARQMIPNMGGIDISPLPVILGLKVLTFLLVQPMAKLGSVLCIYGFAGVR